MLSSNKTMSIGPLLATAEKPKMGNSWPAGSQTGDDQDDEHELDDEEYERLIGILGFDPREP